MDARPRLPVNVLEMLRCPICRGPLRDGSLCDRCPRAFLVVDGIPVLLNESNSAFRASDFEAWRGTFFSELTTFESFLDSLLPSFSNASVSRANYKRLERLLRERTAEPTVLVVGGSIVGVGMEPLVEAAPPIRLVETDVSLGPRTALVCDAHDLPFADEVFDGVVIQAVLEHLFDPDRAAAEIRRVLAPGGIVYAESPFLYPTHAHQDFFRFTELGHRRLFRGFEELSSGVVNGPGIALALAWQAVLVSFATRRTMRGALSAFARLSAFPLTYVDRILRERPGALDAAASYFFLGKKSDATLSPRELVSDYRGALTSRPRG